MVEFAGSGEPDSFPTLAQLVNNGQVWSAIQPTGVDSVIALPTTLAQLSIYNNEDDGGLSYRPLKVFAIVTSTPAGLSQFGIVHCIHRDKPATLPGADIALSSIINRKPRFGAYAGRARIDLALTVANDFWEPLGYSILNAVTGVGWQADIWLDDLIIIPPGGLYSLAIVATTITVQTRLGISWAEEQL
jgi:hypothetical protein